ncbi:apoptosis facilitator Bcl-2-like protein 14 isoform X2 [Eucyclogobius newberryi]|uniref:apoptosis facilitator Bcl-2-like protein 14 isoform X2 n=1 Tax=Eucyclogobius newberryi TaxID=166745 RepID=UPI003B5B0E15
MANGHIEIHDPFNAQHGTKNGTSNSESTEDMVELRILMAYAQRRRPKQTTSEQDDASTGTPKDNDARGSPSTQTEGITVEKKKKKKIWRHFPKVLMCLKPQSKDEISTPCYGDERTDRSGWKEEEDLENVASRLAEIFPEVLFVPPELESDAPEDEVEKVIGLLLRDAGDRLYERELKDTNISDLLRDYNFFERVILSLFSRMGLMDYRRTNADSLGPKESLKTQIAVACEATTRLSVLDTLPMNRLMVNGARFLNVHFSSWAEQQGGYEKAFDSDEDEVH